MKRTIISAAVLSVSLIGGGVSFAGHDDEPGPGPNGHNNRGLCTAYFSGSDNGQENKRKAGPFAALEAAADDAETGNQDGETTVEEVAAFCDATAAGWGNNGGGGGNGGGKKDDGA